MKRRTNISKQIQNAKQALLSGKLVVFPTETVYGLGTNANDPEAVSQIFRAKGRPSSHPVIVHIGKLEQLSQWAINIPREAYLLAKRYWPGPLTLILESAPSVSGIITGGQATIGVRIPRHPIALELLEAFGSGIAAPSANTFGRLSPTSVNQISSDIAYAADVILDGGVCEVGIESTIVDLSGSTARILRPGMLSIDEIKLVLGEDVCATAETIFQFPGGCNAHYAPITPLFLLSSNMIASIASNRPGTQPIVAVVCSTRMNLPSGYIQKFLPRDPTVWARQLYATLRKFDLMEPECIIVEIPPKRPEWIAILDRLSRAASPSSGLKDRPSLKQY